MKTSKLNLADVPLLEKDPGSPPPPPPPPVADEAVSVSAPISFPINIDEVKLLCLSNKTLIIGNVAFAILWMSGNSLLSVAVWTAMTALMAGHFSMLVGNKMPVPRLSSVDAAPYADATVAVINRGAGFVERVFLCGEATEALQALVVLRLALVFSANVSLFSAVVLGFNLWLVAPFCMAQAAAQLPKQLTIARGKTAKVEDLLLNFYAQNPLGATLFAVCVGLGLFFKLSYFDEFFFATVIGLALKSSKAAQTKQAQQLVAASAVAAVAAAGNFKEYAKRRMSVSGTPTKKKQL